LFRQTSWQSVFEGMGIRPRKYCPRVDSIDSAQLASALKTAKAAIHGMVTQLPVHEQALSGRVS
jgi:tryptophan halogenase